MTAKRYALWEVVFGAKRIPELAAMLEELTLVVGGTLDSADDLQAELERKVAAGDDKGADEIVQRMAFGHVSDAGTVAPGVEAAIARAISTAVSIANSHRSPMPYGVWQASDVASAVRIGEVWIDA